MNGKPGPGGYSDPILEAWALRFGLDYHTSFVRRLLSERTCWQLSMCRDDEARRLLLGVSA